jgi:hypothetical protein
MGALRAAERAPFGMEGIGKIFEAYRDGPLEDDDEVALVHGPPETGFRPLSEALVDIRSTLAAAEAAGVLGPVVRADLEAIARALFYPGRSYPLILRRAAAQGLPATVLDAFRAWLPAGRVQQKRQDALAMLRVMRARLTAGLGPKAVCYLLEHTLVWRRAMGKAGDDPSADFFADPFSRPPRPASVARPSGHPP